MNKLFIALLVFVVLFSGSSSVALAQSESNIAGFISATGGIFNLTFPEVGPAGQAIGEDVGFEDVYGSKNGLSYGGEGGIGLSDIGLFGVIKYRMWKKHGDPVIIGQAKFDGDVDWTQTFICAGGRWFMVQLTRTSKTFLPFIGAGFVHSEAKEEMKGELQTYGEPEYVDLKGEVDGSGFYVEAGADLYVAQNISLRGYAEYSDLNLGISDSGVRAEIEGGGGIFAGVSLSMFFGKSMKKS